MPTVSVVEAESPPFFASIDLSVRSWYTETVFGCDQKQVKELVSSPNGFIGMEIIMRTDQRHVTASPLRLVMLSVTVLAAIIAKPQIVVGQLHEQGTVGALFMELQPVRRTSGAA